MKRVHIGVMQAIASMLGADSRAGVRGLDPEQRRRGKPNARKNSTTSWGMPTNKKAKARTLFRRQVADGLIVTHDHPSPRKRLHEKHIGPAASCKHPIHKRQARYRRNKPPKFYCGLCRANC